MQPKAKERKVRCHRVMTCFSMSEGGCSVELISDVLEISQQEVEEILREAREEYWCYVLAIWRKYRILD